MVSHLASNGRKIKSGVCSSLIIPADEELRPQGARIFAMSCEGCRDSRFAATRISSQPEKVLAP